MRQWWTMVALGAVAAMVVATPATAFGGNGDDAPRKATEPVAERVMDQTQNRFGSSDAVGNPDGEQEMQRDRLRLRDGTGDTCPDVGDQARDRDSDRNRDRDRLRDGSGAGCDGDCVADREQLRQRMGACADGQEAAWQFTRHHGWTMHVAV
jgi:hypothetical protein